MSTVFTFLADSCTPQLVQNIRWELWSHLNSSLTNCPFRWPSFSWFDSWDGIIYLYCLLSFKQGQILIQSILCSDWFCWSSRRSSFLAPECPLHPCGESGGMLILRIHQKQKSSRILLFSPKISAEKCINLGTLKQTVLRGNSPQCESQLLQSCRWGMNQHTSSSKFHGAETHSWTSKDFGW